MRSLNARFWIDNENMWSVRCSVGPVCFFSGDRRIYNNIELLQKRNCEPNANISVFFSVYPLNSLDKNPYCFYINIRSYNVLRNKFIRANYVRSIWIVYNNITPYCQHTVLIRYINTYIDDNPRAVIHLYSIILFINN